MMWKMRQMLKSNIIMADIAGYLSIFLLFLLNNIAQDFSWACCHSTKRLYFRASIAGCGQGITYDPVSHKYKFWNSHWKRSVLPFCPSRYCDVDGTCDSTADHPACEGEAKCCGRCGCSWGARVTTGQPEDACS